MLLNFIAVVGLIAWLPAFAAAAASPNVEPGLARELGAKMGVDLGTVYRAVTKADRAAILKLLSYADTRGLGPSDELYHAEQAAIRARCAKMAPGSPDCLTEGTRLAEQQKELHRLEKLKASDGFLNERILLSTMIYHHHFIGEILRSETRRLSSVCRQGTGAPTQKKAAACESAMRRYALVNDATHELVTVADARLRKTSDAGAEKKLSELLQKVSE